MFIHIQFDQTLLYIAFAKKYFEHLAQILVVMQNNQRTYFAYRHANKLTYNLK